MSEPNELIPKEETAQTTPAVPNYFFSKDENSTPAAPPVEVDKAADLVETVLQAGIVHKVQTDEGVKEKILETADSVIDTHLKVAKSEADKADKKAFFEANEAACSYFGYDEKTTNKSSVMLMKAWSWFFNTPYIVTIGFFLVAPITFFVYKIRVVVKKTWLVLLLALLIYALIVLTPFFIVWLGRV